jgi:nicotinamidase/pyrazinamidase
MKTVFIDVDTQIDFMFPSGALYVAGAEEILPKVAALNRFASQNGIPLLSTADAHSENDPEFANWPAHCVLGTVGQLKPVATLLESRATVPHYPVDDLPDAAQIIIEKEKLDVFTNPNLEALLQSLNAERYVVYGVVTEICVRHAAFGLLKRGKARVEIVTDGVRSLKHEDSNRMLEEFAKLGGAVTTTAAIFG